MTKPSPHLGDFVRMVELYQAGALIEYHEMPNGRFPQHGPRCPHQHGGGTMSIVMKLLQLLPPETAHNLVMAYLKMLEDFDIWRERKIRYHELRLKRIRRRKARQREGRAG